MMSFNHCTRVAFLGLVLLLTPGCLTLDGFAHNPRHCSVVGPQTCEDVEIDYERLCTPCDEPYDWSAQFPWPEGFLIEGQTIRTPAEVEAITLETDDGQGTLDMYWLPTHGESPDRALVTLVYQHGNFGSVEHFVGRMTVLHELGYNVLIWDYRGYGKSTPDQAPSTDAFLADARQVYEYASNRAPDPEKMIVYGMSLGTIPSLEMVLSSSPCALILEVPFTSIGEIANTNAGVSIPGGFLTRGYFENVDRIADYTGPLMIIHGTEDQLFPLESVQQLYDNAPGPKVFRIVEGARHGVGDGVVETAGFQTYGAFIADFLEDEAKACL